MKYRKIIFNIILCLLNSYMICVTPGLHNAIFDFFYLANEFKVNLTQLPKCKGVAFLYTVPLYS